MNHFTRARNFPFESLPHQGIDRILRENRLQGHVNRAQLAIFNLVHFAHSTRAINRTTANRSSIRSPGLNCGAQAGAPNSSTGTPGLVAFRMTSGSREPGAVVSARVRSILLSESSIFYWNRQGTQTLGIAQTELESGRFHDECTLKALNCNGPSLAEFEPLPDYDLVMHNQQVSTIQCASTHDHIQKAHLHDESQAGVVGGWWVTRQ